MTMTGKLLGRRLVIARAEKLVQNRGYQEIHSTLRSNLASDWIQMVEEWNIDRTKPCPYIASGSAADGVTEQSIRADLRKEEVDAAAETKSVTKDCSPLSVVIQGLHLEQMQYVSSPSHFKQLTHMIPSSDVQYAKKQRRRYFWPSDVWIVSRKSGCPFYGN